MNIRHGLLAIALAGTAVAASAQTVYFGFGGGATRINADCTGTISCDNNDTGWKAYGGYNINPLFGVEAIGYDMGTPRAVVPIFGFGPVNATLNTTGFALAGVINVPLGTTVDLMGRLGIASNKLKAGVAGSGFSGSDSETSTDALWGIGLGFRLTPNVSIRTEIDGTSATFGGERFDSTLFSLGVSFRF
ncbi:MAG TPA: porin family protein [Burkholderiaceae bacterium]|nr:porin family protein [Burkholderiaceae bacterium]